MLIAEYPIIDDGPVPT